MARARSRIRLREQRALAAPVHHVGAGGLCAAHEMGVDRADEPVQHRPRFTAREPAEDRVAAQLRRYARCPDALPGGMNVDFVGAVGLGLDRDCHERIGTEDGDSRARAHRRSGQIVSGSISIAPAGHSSTQIPQPLQ